eukprot:TRINITY_DN2701_c2_g2_i1.p1 TRINITY_DN2701_c2_g2~~TRINITY_DN2701_c2_g2_i1.p1  ORF type:complete len:893 (+),score=279.00 TRINITY_DN2701_c2_g2_i1:111-2681(+)
MRGAQAVIHGSSFRTECPAGPTVSLLEAARGAGWLRRVLSAQKRPSPKPRAVATPLVPTEPLRSPGLPPTIGGPRAATVSPHPHPHPHTRQHAAAGARGSTAPVLDGARGRVSVRNGAAQRAALRTPGVPSAGELVSTANTTAAISSTERTVSVPAPAQPTPAVQMPHSGSDGPSSPAGAAAVETAASVRSPDDQFSGDERSIIQLLSACRTAPAQFADDIEREYILRPPEVSSPQNVRRARHTLAALRKGFAESRQELGALAAQQGKEIAEVQSQLDELDNSFAGKKAAKPPPKAKSKAPQSPVEDPRKVLQRTMEELRCRHTRELVKAQQQADRLGQATAACAGGVARVESTLAALRAQAPLRALRYSRGLSLSARERAALIGEQGGDSGEGEAQWPQMLRRYGLPVGRTGTAVVLGARSAMGATFDALCDARCRATLLRPELCSAGCGWQRHRQERSVAVVALAEAFADCRHVRARPHCTLAEVRHQFTTSVDPFLFPILFLGDTGVEAVEPTEHPISCGPVAELLLRVPDNVEVAAALESDAGGAVVRVAQQGVSVLVQWEATRRVRVRAALPHAGTHHISVFARRAGAVGFAHIGSLQVESSGWELGQRPVQFAEPTAVFSERKLGLVEPLHSPLRAGEPINFAVRSLSAPDAARGNADTQRQLEAKEAEVEAVVRRVELLRSRLCDMLPMQPFSPCSDDGSMRRQSQAITSPKKGGRQEPAALTPEQEQRQREYLAAKERHAQQQAAIQREIEAQLRREVHLRMQHRLLVLACSEGDRPSSPSRLPNSPAEDEVEVVCGGVRKALLRTSVKSPSKGGARLQQWERAGVVLPPGVAVLLVGGECVARWHVS